MPERGGALAAGDGAVDSAGSRTKPRPAATGPRRPRGDATRCQLIGSGRKEMDGMQGWDEDERAGGAAGIALQRLLAHLARRGNPGRRRSWPRSQRRLPAVGRAGGTGRAAHRWA